MIEFLFSFQGRVRRRDYCLFNLALFILVCCITAPELAQVDKLSSLLRILSTGYHDFYAYLGRILDRLLAPLAVAPGWLKMTIGYACFGAIAWVRLALAVKRWHDRDKSGYWVLIELLPVVGLIWSFIQTIILPGTVGDNQYGPDPKAQGTTEGGDAHIPARYI
ncbi:DUF805 domain-containing protein [Asticcacaulis excentricus]|uniref:DUF805 domain-containing protein n=1 Tax=Asticcacaulis excentricus TaxID=78587 RepID=UPI00156262CE|nr:DUF805 domain-containing protein [Asticcacaulis excentricus]